jgi:peptidase E
MERIDANKMTLFLTSSPIGIYRSEEPLDYKGFNPANGMVENLKRFWVKDSRCLYISAFTDEYELNDRLREDYESIVKDTGLSLSCMDICDSRNGEEIAEELCSYDFVILGGGHVPTENAFFRKTGLADRFRGYQGIVMGISAGTMNCARIVYAQPELPGEAADPSFERFIPGLGLTEYNILPHYNAVKNDILDGMRLFEDIACADSYGHTFYALTDGSYLLQTDGHAEIRGEAYMIRDGKTDKISADGESVMLY